jgi:hypothetical protein
LLSRISQFLVDHFERIRTVSHQDDDLGSPVIRVVAKVDKVGGMGLIGRILNALTGHPACPGRLRSSPHMFSDQTDT